MNARRPALWLAVFLVAVAGQAAGQDPSSEWNLLRQIVLVPGLSGQEGPVMDFIQSRLPRALAAHRDDKGNLWFTVGQGRPHLLFVAHADELGFTVESIGADGIVRLKGRGGFLTQACEAQSFVIHTARGPVEGVIRPRPDFDAAQPQPFAPEVYELDIGATSESDARSLGVAEGNPVIYKKSTIDLGSGLMACRAVDDRAGCAALLAAVLQTDWSKLKGKTITCAWSVEEEVGLNGAAALAQTLKPDFVFAVDTFVSSDSPLENKRFAFAPLGAGAVLRALDSSNLTPGTILDKTLRVATRAKIPVQLANSRGGNDGSVFVPGGAVDIPLAWPGAYAHSFIEKIDRQDLRALTLLIKAIMTEF